MLSLCKTSDLLHNSDLVFRAFSLAGYIVLDNIVVVKYNKCAILCFMTEYSKKLGENLKRIRIKKNITQTEIAKKLGADRSFVSNIENGKNNPTLSTITNLADAVGVSVNELLK